MSRAFFPPDTLSKSDIYAIASVRRSIWSGGFLGLGTGLLSGFGFHHVLSVLSRRFDVALPPAPKPDFEAMRPPLKAAFHEAMWHARPNSGNSRVLFCLGFGALFSYLGAASAGRNNVVFLQDVYLRGATPVLTDYQRLVEEGKRREEEGERGGGRRK